MPCSTTNGKTISVQISEAIEELKRSSINGCITGSAMLDADFDSWEIKPDIDIFVYGENWFLLAIDELRFRMGYEFGEDGDSKHKAQEAMKFQWAATGRQNKGFDTALTTVKLHRGDVIVNVSHRKGQKDAFDVIKAFDMSIVMRGWDIPHGYEADLRMVFSDNPKVARPNLIRCKAKLFDEIDSWDVDMWSVDRWVRQFTRALKYWDRGYDTRPMGEFYVSMIDQVLDSGLLWTSDKSKEMYDAFSADFKEMKERIEEWLKDIG